MALVQVFILFTVIAVLLTWSLVLDRRAQRRKQALDEELAEIDRDIAAIKASHYDGKL